MSEKTTLQQQATGTPAPAQPAFQPRAFGLTHQASRLRLGADSDRHERAAEGAATLLTGQGAAGPLPTLQPITVPDATAEALPVEVETGIGQARGAGRPLPERLRVSLERGLGHHFGEVRLHTDSRAERLSDTIDARAFTVGSDIFFGRGEYGAGAASRRLLAHELAHVVQQAPAPGLVQRVRRTTPGPRGRRLPTRRRRARVVNLPAPMPRQGQLVNAPVPQQAGAPQSPIRMQHLPTPSPQQATFAMPVPQGFAGPQSPIRMERSPQPQQALMSTGSDQVQALLDQGEPDKAIELGRQLVEATNERDLPRKVGEALRGLGRYEEAIAYYEQAYVRTGGMADAKLVAECAEAVFRAASTNIEAAYKAAKYYRLGGEPNNAITWEHIFGQFLPIERATFYEALYEETKLPADARQVAITYREHFKKQANPEREIAYKIAHYYKLAGDERKADIWYRVLRRQFWKSTKRGDVRLTGVSNATHNEEADRHLKRLADGEVAEYRSIQMLEFGDGFFSLYKKEELPVKPGKETIAFTSEVKEQLKQYNDHTIDPARKEAIKRRMTELGIGDPSSEDHAAIEKRAQSFTVKYARTAQERDALRLRKGDDGKIYQGPDSPGAQPFDTSGMRSIASGSKYAIFAMDATGRIYATEHKISRVHHTSPLAGGDVAAAGELVVLNGEVKAITNKSGHYAPNERHAVQSFNELEKSFGVNLAQLEFRFFTDKKKVTFNGKDHEIDRRWWDTKAAGFHEDAKDSQKLRIKRETLDLAIVANSKKDPHSWTP